MNCTTELTRVSVLRARRRRRRRVKRRKQVFSAVSNNGAARGGGGGGPDWARPRAHSIRIELD